MIIHNLQKKKKMESPKKMRIDTYERTNTLPLVEEEVMVDEPKIKKILGNSFEKPSDFLDQFTQKQDFHDYMRKNFQIYEELQKVLKYEQDHPETLTEAPIISITEEVDPETQISVKNASVTDSECLPFMKPEDDFDGDRFILKKFLKNRLIGKVDWTFAKNMLWETTTGYDADSNIELTEEEIHHSRLILIRYYYTHIDENYTFLK